jgi:uncharacterized protein YbjT (DUF2867 family)
MRILVIGAYGLIGGSVTTRLIVEGHQVVGLGRDAAAARRRFPAAHWVEADLRRMTEADWSALLAEADAVVNCAGALQESPRDSMLAVHLGLAEALAQACRQAGVRRVVHISAAGLETGDDPFRRAKREAEHALSAADLDWVILRPGLVMAPAAFGGGALLRGLAAFPFVVPTVDAAAIVQTVSVDDVTEAIVRSLTVMPARFICDLIAVEETRLSDILLAIRAWLGLPPAPLLILPPWMGSLTAAAADALAWLGWRSPMRTAAARQLASGVTGRAGDALERLGFTPRPLAETLAAWPSGVQERWFARLYFVKPMVLATLAGFWAASGVIGLVQHAAAASLLTGAGLSPATAGALVIGGGALDLVLAGLVCFRPTARLGLQAMVLVTLAYLAGASLWLPQLWSDPLGPLVKSVPAAILALAALTMLDER